MNWDDIDYLQLKIPEWVRKKARVVGLAIVFSSLVLLGLTDYLTGYELSFSIFYLIPISVATLSAGPRWGVLVSTTAALIWLEADLLSGHIYSQPLIPYWNALVRLGYFLLHTALLASLLSLLQRTKDLSLKDPLTGAANSRYFQELATRELLKAQRSQNPLTIVYTDVDDFKRVNDTLGHSAGDNFLRLLVEAMRSQIRPGDLLARMGGDEFVLLFPDTEYRQAAGIIERIRDALFTRMEKNSWPVGLSIGAVTFTSMPSSVETLISQADNLMYQVKRQGKNTILHQTWPGTREKEFAGS